MISHDMDCWICGWQIGQVACFYKQSIKDVIERFLLTNPSSELFNEKKVIER